jgi:hypothetical protein
VEASIPEEPVMVAGKHGGVRVSGPLRHAFIDESGTVAPFSGSHFLVIALLGMTRPRPIELHVKRALKKYGTSLASGEMKADASREVVVKQLLQAIAQESVTIIAVVVDKQNIARPPTDPEEMYREAVTRVVRHAVARWPRIDVCLDKRYTAKHLRYELEKVIREGIADLHQEVVIIRQEDSIACKELQATDYVAWAFFQKYERGDSSFYEIIADRVVIEEVISRRLW